MLDIYHESNNTIRAGKQVTRAASIDLVLFSPNVYFLSPLSTQHLSHTTFWIYTMRLKYYQGVATGKDDGEHGSDFIFPKCLFFVTLL